MPYQIIHFPNNKYKVYNKHSNKYMSNKYQTLEQAKKQIIALYLNEKIK